MTRSAFPPFRRAAIRTLAVAATLAAAPLAAQEKPPRSFCFNGAPAAKCGTFVVAEMQGVLPVIRNTRERGWSAGDSHAVTPYQDRLQWELGLMHNVSERWALGGTARLGAGGGDRALTGLALRGRRWLSDDIALDVSTGATFVEHSTPNSWGHKTGFMADARINFRDDAYVGMRFEELAIDPFTGPDGGYDRGGHPRALSLLLGTGSEWALGGSAALGLGLVVLLALVDWE